VQDDIRAVVDAASGVPVKAILECHYLTADEYERHANCAIKAGAAFVKTGTGWAPTGATLENIATHQIMRRRCHSNQSLGGIRDIETLAEMHRRGARRFGIGLDWIARILDRLERFTRGKLKPEVAWGSQPDFVPKKEIYE